MASSAVDLVGHDDLRRLDEHWWHNVLKLDSAIRFTLPIGLHKGETIGHVAKAVPHGLTHLHGLYRKRVWGDTKEALRSFLAAPEMVPYLRRALGAQYRHEDFLLPEDVDCCRCCGDRRRIEDDPVMCAHGVQRGLKVTATCGCGFNSVAVLEHPRMACPGCDVA